MTAPIKLDRTMPTILIGLDCSFGNFGIVGFDLAKKEVIKTWFGNFSGAMDAISMSQGIVIENFVFIVENPNLDSAVFDGWSKIKGEIVRYKNGQTSIASVEKAARIALKVAQDIGNLKTAATLTIAKIREIQAKYENVYLIEVAPSARQSALKNKLLKLEQMRFPLKTTAEQFKALTGYERKTNEHVRDAGTLCLGWTFPSLEIAINQTNSRK